MNDLQLMARVRNELLNALFSKYPIARTRALLTQQLEEIFTERTAEWLTDAVNEQLGVLRNAGLIRPLAGGFTLTERGRADRLAAKQLLKSKLNGKGNPNSSL
ncbi:MAG: hypothetical protein ACO28M_12030 [Vulcanococcus sp.]|jgi:hypothetical protein